MKQILLIIFCCAFVSIASGQTTRHIVQLTDKQGTPHTISDPSTYLSARSILRRTSQRIAIDSTDLPLSPSYIAAIAGVPNVQVLNVSKWLNQVLIRTNDPSALTIINNFSFVKSTKQIANNSVKRYTPSKLDYRVFNAEKPVVYGINKKASVTRALGTNKIQGTLEEFSYGSTLDQIHIHEGEFLHKKGFTGEGVVMAMMDAGYNGYLGNPVFDSIRNQGRILGTWDYVMNEESVNEDHVHGALCFSTIAANRPGSMVGTAPHASFWLFRTEDDASETPVEEQNWIAAAEFADSAGAQLFSTSLGYYAFDDPSLSYSHAQRDGKTAMITRAATLAAKKGILLTCSAGNSGYEAGENKYVMVPADADSVLTVGAVDYYNNIAGFSSPGPNGAGKRKPNIVSVGVGTIFAWTDGSPMGGNGTSLSNPNVAGLVACLWQAFPEQSNMSIIDAVQKSSDKYGSPDDYYGNGLPNFRKAYNYLMTKSFTGNLQYIKGNASLSWNIKTDTSVTFIIERKAPGSNIFLGIDTITSDNSTLAFRDFLITDSVRSTRSGDYLYRIQIVVRGDNTSYSPEYSFRNNWSSMVADSLKLGTTGADCAATISWSMPEDATVQYKLEKQSPGATSFATIATINGTGSYNDAGSKSHSYVDAMTGAPMGTFNYRLQVIMGIDTTFYSRTSSFVNNNACITKEGYYFSPSPFKSDIIAIVNTNEGSSNMAIVLYDITGRAVYKYQSAKPNGYFSHRIPASNLKAGVYVAAIMINNRVVHRQKLVR
ncbi:MAG: T9SS type A sorting domain-containing protein [Chitinophagaceae bacterium]|nr:MAG: T9SS type A sorting domain-containing protein [Chitinophagaceae bacterium]